MVGSPSHHGTREDEVHPTLIDQIAAERIAELHQQAAMQHLVRQLRAADAARPRNGRVRVGRVRLGFRRSRPVTP
jgi:hypothetical protein